MPILFRTLQCLGILLIVVSVPRLSTASQDPRTSGVDEQLRQELGLPPGVPLGLVTIATGKETHVSKEEAKKNAPRIAKFEACHVGQQRVLFKITFADSPVYDNGSFLLYADLDCNPATGRQDSREHRGVDLMLGVSAGQVNISRYDSSFTKQNTYLAGAKLVGKVLYLVLDAPLTTREGKVLLDLQLASERHGGHSDSTRRQIVELRYVPDRNVPKVSKGVPSLRPLSDYRYHDALVKLEKLADKGLTRQQVTPDHPVPFGRPRPAAPYCTTMRKPGQAGSIKLEGVPVELLEEAGVARSRTAVSFGFPLPQGAVFDVDNLRVLAPGGEEVPAQLTVTSFWPDDSLKWVLVDFTAPLAAKQAVRYAIELGSAVHRGAGASPLTVENGAQRLTVVTGPLKVEIDKQRFQLFRAVWLDANGDGRFDAAEQVAACTPEGVRLVDEHGKVFTLSGRPPESVKIEEQGPQKVVVRVEGQYAATDGATYMRYIARLIFRAGSPRVTLVYTHVNDYLETEFTDVTSLTASLQLAGGIQKTAISRADRDGPATVAEGQDMALFQSDEAHSALRSDGHASQGGAAPGTLRCVSPQGTLTAVVHDFAERWPKGLSADAQELRIELLPKQPGPNFGKGLPHYLLFPFVEGFYRFKWGMSVTDRVTFDFSGRTSPAELLAEAQTPVVSVLAGSWYSQTKALGPLAAPLGKQFALWDKYVASSFQNYLTARARDRAFGYLNYGDWYGERVRNWGNNEYDFAHGYFMQFARTGNRDFFRAALTAARHQADVDCVHAYPDPYYVGANHLHSVGHTGMWSEVPSHGQWSWRYDYHTSAANGHTWADGMMEAWYLTGEAPIIESALGLGEHIAWGMSRTFTSLGTHERSAGWSLKAIMAIYRGTYDPVYLEAARRIATVALREQKFDDGGAWPHLLPDDHAGGHAGARGNAIFLVGIVLGGLKEYDEVVHDPAVQKSILSGARWLLKCWDEEAEGWPYTALVSGEPLFPPGPGSNGLVCEPLAYAGHLSGDKHFIHIAETGLASLARGSGMDGKSIAQQMNFSSGTLALLQEWYAAHRKDKGASAMTGSGEDMAAYLSRTHDAREYSVRAPNVKIFVVRLAGAAGGEQPPALLTAARKPFGAMTKGAEFGTIQVLDAAGGVVKQGQFNTDDSHQFTCSLSGAADAVFKVVIHDDQRGVWNLVGDRLRIVAQTVPGFCIGGVGRSRYHFFVPEGTQEFHVKLRAGHRGMFAGVVVSPAKKVVGFFEGVNQPAAPGDSKGKTARQSDRCDRGSITVKPDPHDTGKAWSLVLTAGGDIYCELEGVPPYLSLKADTW